MSPSQRGPASQKGTQRPRHASEALSEHAPQGAAAAVDEQLARYRAMRDFDMTAEPSGTAAAEGADYATELPFCIQKHDATRLHYDFRLGWRGVLKSWAVAKGPSFVVRDKRLAVEVEDHPIEYGGFEGAIPKGQYGGGTVLLWDHGSWEPQPGHDFDQGLRSGSLKFILHGKRLQGKWALIRMGGKAAHEAKPNWLLIKEHDAYEQPADAPSITESEPDSVVTGRSLAQIAADQDHVWNSKPQEKAAPNRSRLAGTLSSRSTAPPNRKDELAGAPAESLPGFLAPQLAAPAHRPPAGSGWLYELKLDGYRVQLHIERRASGPSVTIYTRSGLDWTHRMPAVAAGARALRLNAAILDGEVVVLDAQGGSSFSALQAAFDEGAPNALTCFAFDLLHLDGHNLRGLPLGDRKALLERLLSDRTEAAETLRFGEHVAAEGAAAAAQIFAQACALGAEGMIAKLASSRYTGGRSENWVKLKCVRRQEFVIAGFTLPKDRGAGLGSLLLGYYASGELVHCGRTGTGFTQTTAQGVRTRLEALRTDKQPYAGKLSAPARKDAIWVRPELVCEVEFATWTADGSVRHASFQGLREDKPPTEVIREDSAPAEKKPRAPVAAVGKAAAPSPGSKAARRVQPRSRPATPPDPGKKAEIPASEPANRVPIISATEASSRRAGNVTEIVAKLKLTHPDKVLDAQSGVTKQELALYYEAIAEAMLPHVAGRPASLVRCPDGSAKPCFFQKHAGAGLPKTLGSVAVPDKKTAQPEAYITVGTAEGLISLAQLGVLEVHPWGSRNQALEQPDRLIFDLDPDEALPWPRLVASARAIRDFLLDLKLKSFVKSTGGKGLHLVVPITPEIAWPQVKLFCRGVAIAIESSDPELYLIKMTKAARKNRIFIDYLRNERGATAIAPWSPRARSGMRVAVPLDWSELDRGAPAYSVANFHTWRDRLRDDPWAAMPSSRQALHPQVLAAVLGAAGSQG